MAALGGAVAREARRAQVRYDRSGVLLGDSRVSTGLVVLGENFLTRVDREIDGGTTLSVVLAGGEGDQTPLSPFSKCATLVESYVRDGDADWRVSSLASDLRCAMRLRERATSFARAVYLGAVAHGAAEPD